MSQEKKNRRHVADVLYDAASRMATSHPTEHLDNLPALSLYAFVTSLMILGRRVLKIGKFELGISEVLGWQRPALTLSFLYAYTKLCYYPQWLIILPLAYFVFFVLIPNYAEKFKIDDELAKVDSDPLLLVINGDDEEKKKNSRTLIKTIKKGQKSLTDLVLFLDKADQFLKGPARFADAHVSSLLLVLSCFVVLIGGMLLAYISLPLLFTLTGWFFVLSKHPLAKLTTEKLEDFNFEPAFGIEQIYSQFFSLAHKCILFDEKPLKRKVEIYELQPQGLTARQWNNLGTVYSNSPYSLNSPNRINKERPEGCAAINEVIPPEGWYFALNEDWIDDQEAAQWTSLNGVMNVEASDAWAYDISHEGLMWRRRRWTRFCYHDAQ